MFSILDSWRKHEYTIYVIIASSFAFMSIGTSTAWSTPSLVKLAAEDSPIQVDSSELSWVASMIAIGGPVAALPYSYLLNKIGRKPMIIAVSLIYIIGWITLILADSVPLLYLGRFLHGISVGCTFGSIPVYIGEAVSQNTRGAIVTLLVLSQSMGTLIVLAVGPLVELLTLNLISAISPVLMLISFTLIPETPYFLLKNGKKDEARQVLMKFRGCYKEEDVQEEIKSMEAFLEESPKSGFWESLKQLAEPRTKKAILIITVLLIGQQLSGLAAITIYMQAIFIEIDSPIKSNIAVLLSEIMADVSVLATSVYMDRLGRKPLYSASSFICIVCNLGLGAYYLIRSEQVSPEYAWIPMVGIFLLRIGYDVGMSPVPMVVTSEILSFNVKGLVSAYFAFIQGLVMAVVIKMFHVVKVDLGQHYTHFMFAISVFVTMLFIIMYMPETKNKSFSEIQQALDNNHKYIKRTETYKKNTTEYP